MTYPTNIHTLCASSVLRPGMLWDPGSLAFSGAGRKNWTIKDWEGRAPMEGEWMPLGLAGNI